MTDNELLLALSNMMDEKFKAELHPIKNNIKDLKSDVHNIKLFQENIILPRLQTI